jgi:hypothetical protein
MSNATALQSPPDVPVNRSFSDDHLIGFFFAPLFCQ